MAPIKDPYLATKSTPYATPKKLTKDGDSNGYGRCFLALQLTAN